MYDVVALLEDLPAANLRRGEIGAVIEEHEPDVYEVEFSDQQGVPHALVVLRADQRSVVRDPLA